MSDQIEVQDPGAIAREMLAGVPLSAADAPPPAVSAETGVDRSSAAASAENGAAGSLTPPAPDAPRDARGHVFRPEFHRLGSDGKPFVNKHGLFMPRGGRKPKNFAPPPPPMAPGESPWSSAEKTAASAPPPVVDEKKKEEPAAAAPTSHADISDNSDDASEVFCRAIYTVTGFAFDAPAECQPRPAEHDNMRRAFAAYLRSKGWKSSAGVGIVLMLAAYLLRVLGKPVPAAKLKSWFADWRANRAKPVEKTTPEKESAPSSAVGPARVVLTPSLDNLSEGSA